MGPPPRTPVIRSRSPYVQTCSCKLILKNPCPIHCVCLAATWSILPGGSGACWTPFVVVMTSVSSLVLHTWGLGKPSLCSLYVKLSSRRSHLKYKKSFQRPGLRTRPTRWGIYSAAPDSPAGWEGWMPLPKNPNQLSPLFIFHNSQLALRPSLGCRRKHTSRLQAGHQTRIINDIQKFDNLCKLSSLVNRSFCGSKCQKK